MRGHVEASDSRKSPDALREARERFVREHLAESGGCPRRLAEIAVTTGFYSAKQARSQIAWRFTRTLSALSAPHPRADFLVLS